jgi:anti-anti-sigma factor
MPTLPQLSYTWDDPAVHIRRVTLDGELVSANADQLLMAITEDLSSHEGRRALHIDCAGVELCDSRGLSALLMLRRRTESLGIELHVVNRGAALQHLLERTGTDEYLTGETRGDARPDEETSG